MDYAEDPSNAGEPSRTLRQRPKPTGQGRPVVFTGASLLEEEFPEPRWAIPGLVPEGGTILAGKPKKGKSFLALDFSVAVATGGNVLGSIQVEQGDVLYLALEDTKRRLNERLSKMAGDGPSLTRLHLAVNCPKIGGELEEWLDGWFREYPDTRLVVIDTLAYVRPVRSGTPTYPQDYEDMGALKALADRHGTSFLVVHHQRKGDADDAVDTVSGTLGLTGAADGWLLLVQQKGGRYVLQVQGRDVEEQEHAIQRDRSTGKWTLLASGEDNSQRGLTPRQRQAIQVLRTAPGPLGPTAFAKLASMTEGASKVLLSEMQAAGLLAKLHRGLYSTFDHPCYLTYLGAAEDEGDGDEAEREAA